VNCLMEYLTVIKNPLYSNEELIVMWSDIIARLRKFHFKELNKILEGIDVLTLLKNPWIIAFMVIVCIIFIIRGMEKALVSFLSVPVLLVLFQKTVQDYDALNFSAERLLVFCGGFIVLAGVNIYFHFVRK
jgi:hypothetical protein